MSIALQDQTPQKAFHGLLLVDKPTGCTSHDVVGRVRRIFGTRSVGHAGTLDPIASGLLVILVGEATKLSNYILNGDKGYEVKVRLGLETDTLDIQGRVLRESEVTASENEIQTVARSLSGVLNLLVPKFSAVKVQGKTLYKEARQGREVEQPSREMNFYDVEILNYDKPFLTVRMKCAKGSYVRSWADELGRRLGCGASVGELRRVWSQPYEIDSACTLEELALKPWENLSSAIPMVATLSDWPTILVEGKDQTLLRNGQISNGLKGRLRVFYRNQQTGHKIFGVKVVCRNYGCDRLNDRQQNEKQLMALLEPGSFEGDFKIARIINNVT